MSGSSFAQMVERVLGKPDKKGTVEVPEETQCTVFVGEPGQGMVVQQVQSLTMTGDLLELHLRDNRGHMCLLISAAHGIQVRPLKGGQEQRTGF